MPSNKPLTPTPQTEVDRLKAAAGLLQENPLWHEALDKMKADYIALWERSQVVAQLERDNAYYMVRAIEGLRGQLQAFAQAGKLSKDVTQNNVKRS